MQNILEELWYGNLNPIEEYLESKEEFSAIMECLCKYQKDFKATLSDEQKAMFEKLDGCSNELEDMNQREIFAYGFRFGAKIAIEVMSFRID